MARFAVLTLAVAALTTSTAEAKPAGGFRWDHEVWGSFEAVAFARHLTSRGVNPKDFKRKHPELIRIFEYRLENGKRMVWPPPKPPAERLIAKRLNRVLCRYGPQCGTGNAYVRSGKRWNVSPFYIAAISAVESTFGQAICAPHNAWGVIAYCGSGFSSWAAGIDYVSRLIRVSFINRGLSNPWSIGRVFCPPCGDGHGDQAAAVMGQYFHSGNGVLWKNAVEAVR